MEKSIYQLISDNITGGALKEGFALPDEDPDDASVKWAPGAMDGVTIYHMHHQALDELQKKKMEEAVQSAAGGNYQEADSLFYEWTKTNRAVSVIDELQEYVIGHSSELDAENVYQTALFMMLQSGHTECVKIGLELMELFKANDDNVKEIIRRLGLYDEFTVFAVWNMQKWESGNDEIFNIAKKVHGWGRIHAVERLEPATDEIRHWILTEGSFNVVMRAYSALTCWIKADAREILFGNPTQDEYKGILMLIGALIDEGPVQGISALDDAMEVIMRLLEITPEYDLTVQDYDEILLIRNWAEDERTA